MHYDYKGDIKKTCELGSSSEQRGAIQPHKGLDPANVCAAGRALPHQFSFTELRTVVISIHFCRIQTLL